MSQPDRDRQKETNETRHPSETLKGKKVLKKKGGKEEKKKLEENMRQKNFAKLDLGHINCRYRSELRIRIISFSKEVPTDIVHLQIKNRKDGMKSLFALLILINNNKK